MPENDISVIIPTLNEVGNITRVTNHIREILPRAEIIISDGGSQDGTPRKVSGMAKIITAEKGRSRQMNAGAKVAQGKILWFLHSDCLPSERSGDLILGALVNDEIVGGGFRWALKGSKWYYGSVTAMAHIKNKLRKNLFGDMGIFVRRNVFEKLNGYADVPFLEDVEFTARLKKVGKIRILDEKLHSSDRRLLEKGPLRSFIKNDLIKLAYGLGFSPGYLAKFY
ncbi:MAG: glycosyltransferase family 2 protein [candidate division Zixibacteria bacterium]|nr:glycosyltransferase family 2 protein [candidate division Zixibacteria bacterium]